MTHRPPSGHVFAVSFWVAVFGCCVLVGCGDDGPSGSPDSGPSTDVSSDTPLDVGSDGGDTSPADVSPDTEPQICTDRQVTFDTEAVDVFYWQGDDVDIARVGIDAERERCGAIRVSTSRPWLRVLVNEGEIVLRIDPARVASGVHELEVRVEEFGGGATLAVLPVTLRAFVAPNPTEEVRPKVLFVGIDGVRSDAMEAADTPAFDRLRARGAWTFDGTTQLSTVTDSSAGWTALMTGVESTKNGVTDNDALEERDWDYPTFAWRATHDLGLTAYVAAQWAPFALSIHEVDAVVGRGLGDAETVTDLVSTELRERDRDLYLLHLDDVDHAGHDSGFSPENPEYIAAIEQADVHIAELLAAILDRPTLSEEDWLIIVTTDHGGEGTGHGGMTEPHRRIPFVFAGPTRPIGRFTDTVSQLDVLPTVLAFLGAEIEEEWDLDGVVRAVSDVEVVAP